MKRLLLVFGLGLLFFAGCEQMNKKMASWVGHNFNDVVASWGPPQSIMDDGAGGKIMTWSYAETETTSNLDGTRETHTTYVRTRTFWVDKNGIIYKWSWRGLF